MKPTNFSPPNWQCCQIIFVLTSDDAIENGIIAERNVYPLISFVLLAWMNDKIHRWICPNPKADIKENRMMMLIGWLYDKGVVFNGRCFSTTIAELLLQKNALSKIKSVKTIKNNFSLSMPNGIQVEAQIIFSVIFERIPKKYPI
jgi:hypothetical protein